MTDRQTLPVLAEVTVEPSGEGQQHRDQLAAVVEALGGPELERRVGPVSTVVSGDLDDVLHAIERAHRVVADSAARVTTTVRLESRNPPLTLDEREREASELEASAARAG